MRYTNEEVKEQLERYNELLKNVDLVKLGRLAFSRHNIENGLHNTYNFLIRYLRMNKIQGSMNITGTPQKGRRSSICYREDLEYKCLRAFIDSCKA